MFLSIKTRILKICDRVIHGIFLRTLMNLYGRIRIGIMEKINYKYIFILLGVLFVISGIFLLKGCKKEHVEFDITGTTPSVLRLGEKGLPDPINIYFNGSAANLSDIGKRVTNGIKMFPEHPGEWMWVNDRQLTFTTYKEWPLGTEFTVKFDKKLFPKHVRLRKYEYIFKTPSFSASITKSEFYLDPKDPKMKKIVATVTFTHPVDTAEFEKKIKIYKEISRGIFSTKEEQYKFTVGYNKYKTEAYIHSELLPVPPNDSELTILIEKGFGSIYGGKNYDVDIKTRVVVPGVFSIFKINNASLTLVRNQIYEPEQVFILETTNGVLSDELIKNMNAYILPVDLPPVQGRSGSKNYHWDNPAIIGPEILALSTELKLDTIPTEFEYSQLHSYKYNADVGRYIYVKIKKGTKSYGDYILANEFNIILRVPEFPKELNIMHEGAILSLSGDKKLSILSRGIEALHFQVSRVLPGQVNHLISQSGGQFKNPYFQNWSFNYDNITETYSEERVLESVGPAKTQYTSFDLTNDILKKREMGLFFFKVQNWDPVRKIPRGIEDKRLILVTDLGMIVKDNKDGSHDIFVQLINSGQPAAGVTVEILGKNGIPIFSRTTNESGHTSFPNLIGYVHEKTPTVYIAKRGDDMSFIPYNWGDRRLNFSRFDTGGVETPSTDNLSAFLFSDRGIYRPGEKITVGMIVKPGDWKQSIAGIPLEVVFTDPRGVEISKQRIRLSSVGFEEIFYQTEDIQPTGNYYANVYTVKDNMRWNLLGTISVRVEEFMPDRLRIFTRLSPKQEFGWVSPDNLIGQVSLYDLFGMAAADHRIKANIVLNPAFPVFKTYNDYSFFDPEQAEHNFTEQLNEQVTNGDGETEFQLNLDR